MAKDGFWRLGLFASVPLLVAAAMVSVYLFRPQHHDLKPCMAIVPTDAVKPSFWVVIYDEDGKFVSSQRYSGTPQEIERPPETPKKCIPATLKAIRNTQGDIRGWQCLY